MDGRGKLGAADELPLGCAQVDEDEVAGCERLAVGLVWVDAPHPDSHELPGLSSWRWISAESDFTTLKM